MKQELKDITDGKLEKSNLGRRTIFHSYVQADLPPGVKTSQGVIDDADILIGAGYETTGHALSTATVHILEDPSIQAKLVSELRAHWLDPSSTIPSWKELESIPYVNACVTEALRMAIGAAMRLPRVNHVAPIHYKDWEIPPHTLVSMTQKDILYNSDIFPEPHLYKPERWLQGEASKHLEKHLVTFSRGSRNCLGQQLALAEMHIALATIFRRFHLELFETTREDVDFERDLLVPVPKKGYRNVRVLVKEQKQ